MMWKLSEIRPLYRQLKIIVAADCQPLRQIIFATFEWTHQSTRTNKQEHFHFEPELALWTTDMLFHASNNNRLIYLAEDFSWQVEARFHLLSTWNHFHCELSVCASGAEGLFHKIFRTWSIEFDETVDGGTDQSQIQMSYDTTWPYMSERGHASNNEPSCYLSWRNVCCSLSQGIRKVVLLCASFHGLVVRTISVSRKSCHSDCILTKVSAWI
jgi:hypothetical protein